MNRIRIAAAATLFALIAVACGGQTLKVAVNEERPALDANVPPEQVGLSEGGRGSVSVGQAQLKTQTQKGNADPKCAVNSNPEHGFTPTTIKWGTIVPLSGALRPLGEQTARVMKTASEVWLNSITKIPGPYDIDWGCSTRPGIYGRKVSLTVFSLQGNTQEEALAGMRRLIDVEKTFLARDCYLQSNLMGPATAYQNQKGVPGVWCFFSEMPYPKLATWNFAPGVDPLKIAATHMGYAVKSLKSSGREPAIGVIADPSAAANQVEVMQRVHKNLVGREIPDSCIVYKKAQDAPNGMRSEITALRQQCNPPSGPNAVIATDTLNAVFGALEAKSQGWRGADFNVLWTCLTCWVQTLAELCGDACQNMMTDCQALPCIPWADKTKYPAAKVLEDVWKQYLQRDPPDILTYGPAAITGGLGLWLGMTGPDLSREKLRHTLENLKDWDAGIGPILNTNTRDHFGGKSVWLIKFTGRAPWFEDLTGRFVPLHEYGISESWTEVN